jgi:hypothetical protein
MIIRRKKTYWIPKSQVYYERYEGKKAVIDMPQWLAEEKGLPKWYSPVTQIAKEYNIIHGHAPEYLKMERQTKPKKQAELAIDRELDSYLKLEYT